jgi:ketosteroid isomerase-like protein
MTQEAVDFVQRGYAAFRSGDLDTALAQIDSGIVLEVHTDRPDMGSATYHGHEGFLANFAELTDVFDDLEVEPAEIDDHGDRILVACRVTGRGKGSGVAIEARIFHVWTMHDGIATRLEIYSDAEQARQAFRR